MTFAHWKHLRPLGIGNDNGMNSAILCAMNENKNVLCCEFYDIGHFLCKWG